MSDNMDAPPGAWDDDSPFVPVLPYLDPATGRPMGVGLRRELTPEAQARRSLLLGNAARRFRGVDFAREADETAITIRPRSPADAALAEAASAVANHMIYGGHGGTEYTVDEAAAMNLDVIDRAFLQAAAYGTSWVHVDTRPDYRSEMRAARDRIAELEAEVEALRKAAGWSDNDAPDLGGERAEGTP